MGQFFLISISELPYSMKGNMGYFVLKPVVWKQQLIFIRFVCLVHRDVCPTVQIYFLLTPSENEISSWWHCVCLLPLLRLRLSQWDEFWFLTFHGKHGRETRTLQTLFWFSVGHCNIRLARTKWYWRRSRHTMADLCGYGIQKHASVCSKYPFTPSLNCRPWERHRFVWVPVWHRHGGVRHKTFHIHCTPLYDEHVTP